MGELPKNLLKLSVYGNLLTRKLDRKAYILRGEKYKQLINKIYSFNNIVVLASGMWSYLGN